MYTNSKRKSYAFLVWKFWENVLLKWLFEEPFYTVLFKSTTKQVFIHSLWFVEFILEDGKLVSDGIASHKNPTSVNSNDG